jgi:hypothetical protein
MRAPASIDPPPPLDELPLLHEPLLLELLELDDDELLLLDDPPPKLPPPKLPPVDCAHTGDELQNSASAMIQALTALFMRASSHSPPPALSRAPS